MRQPGHAHARYRELLSGRLEGSLTRGEAAELSQHLAGCVLCRQAERAYREQRLRLRSLRTVAPPRDLWARTSAGLDREVARRGQFGPFGGGGGARISRRRRRNLATGAAVASVAALGLSLALMANGVAPLVVPSPGQSVALLARATPFTVPSQALAFLGSGAEGLSIYRTRVDHVCPATAIDCLDEERSMPAVVALPRDLQPSNLSMSPSGGQLAIQGREAGGGDVIAVVLMPADEMPASGGTATPAAGSGTQSGTSDSPRPPAATAVSSGDATAGPDGTSSEASSKPPATDDLTSPATASASLPLVPGAADPMATAAEAQAVVAILDDVYSVGAPPAWSPDGTLLAFSAMPADRRHGPDVYVWRTGDERAQPLTSDHVSYFASWAGSNVVASRVSAPSDDEAPTVELTTVTIDPATAEEREFAAGGTWLPHVDPTGTHVVAWHGSLVWDQAGPRAASGALYIGAWSVLDPLSATGSDGETVTDASPATSDYPPVEPTAGGEGAEEAEDNASGATQAPTDEPSADATSSPDGAAATPTPGGADGPPDEPDDVSAPALPAGFAPIEPDRDPVRDPVQDWQVRWSSDGLVLGYWIADVAGASWGELVVVPVDPVTGKVAADELLLQPSLARRAFTLGLNRVAWVAPADDEPEGELRIRTWGADGFGDLRLRPGQLEQVAPPN